jgi:hypothetical protein
MKSVSEVLGIIFISIVTYSVLFYLASCTLSLNVAQSEGESSDMIKEETKTSGQLEITIPAI